jgi:hypothetical protein
MTATAKSVVRFATVAGDLSKGGICDLIGSELSQGLDIVANMLPLSGRNLEIIGGYVFCNFHRLGNYPDLL